MGCRPGNNLPISPCSLLFCFVPILSLLLDVLSISLSFQNREIRCDKRRGRIFQNRGIRKTEERSEEVEVKRKRKRSGRGCRHQPPPSPPPLPTSPSSTPPSPPSPTPPHSTSPPSPFPPFLFLSSTPEPTLLHPNFTPPPIQPFPFLRNCLLTDLFSLLTHTFFLPTKKIQ